MGEGRSEEGTCAPYQVRVDAVLPGCREEKVLSLAAAGDALIWIPRDSESYIRAASEERDERLGGGAVSGDPEPGFPERGGEFQRESPGVHPNLA